MAVISGSSRCRIVLGHSVISFRTGAERHYLAASRGAQFGRKERSPGLMLQKDPHVEEETLGKMSVTAKKYTKEFH